MSVNYRWRVLRRRLAYLKHPLWVDYPENIMLDTHNFCNLDCIYCNVQHSFNLPRGKMPLSTMQTVLNHYKGKLLWSVAPFMNGEPMLDDRLQEIFTMTQQICNTQNVLDTNGTVWANRNLLIHPNLRLVRFTISAFTSETYKKVHGKPLCSDAYGTFNWFNTHKLPTQQPWVHFIANKENEHELKPWLNYFSGFGRSVFPMHRSPKFQLNSEFALGKVVTKPFMVLPDGREVPMQSERMKKVMPCPCYDILAISWDGRILQCCDFPYDYNFGKVGEVDLDWAWHERNKNKMDNPCCSDCSQKFPNWKATIDKWIR